MARTLRMNLQVGWVAEPRTRRVGYTGYACYFTNCSYKELTPFGTLAESINFKACTNLFLSELTFLPILELSTCV